MESWPAGIGLRVAFDQQVFLLQEYGGISRYVCSLARELANRPDVEPKIFAPLHFNRNLENLNPRLREGCALPTLPTKVFRPIQFASRIMARNAISRFRPDIVHETYYSEKDFCPNGVPRVLTVYDLIHERYPELFVNSEGTTRPKRIAVNRADHVICISESTQRDVVQFCGVPKEKTSVVYLGVDFDLAGTTGPKRQCHPSPYLLYVGARGGYKNFERLLLAFSRSQRLRKDFTLVCFGGGGLSAREEEFIAGIGLRSDQVIQLGGGDDILASLYRQAAAFVYPSLYEGFGIPPLEAMALGCPVICSNTSSLPEVVGEAAETFDPTDVTDMQIAMEHVLENSRRRSELVEAGRSRFKLFTWESCARETEAVYRKLL